MQSLLPERELYQLAALAVKAKRVKARRHIIDFAPIVWPQFVVTRHQTHLGTILEQAVRECEEQGYARYVLHAPPQVGKSLFVSTIFPAWFRGKFPDDPIILSAYGDSHAQDFSRKVRNIVASPEYKRIFPGIELAGDSSAVGHWELAPPYHGAFHAAGLMGAVTGKGARLLIIDDPIKNRAEAESKLIRDKQIDAWKSTLSTRLHNNHIVIVMMTRWHEDDLSGWLLKNADPPFKYVRIPALADGLDTFGKVPGIDPLGRVFGQSIWHNRFPEPMMIRQRRSLGTYDWYAMYQGLPRPPEGRLFKRSYFQVIPEAPAGLRWVRYWDLATTTKDSSDFTASLSGAVDAEGNVYLANMIRGRWEWPDVRRKIKVTALSEPGVWCGIESAGMQKGMVQEVWNDAELVNVGITGVPVSTDKRVRALGSQTRGESGRLYLVDGDWIEEFIDECLEFDAGEHDDQVDAMSGVMHMLQMSGGEII